MCWLKVKNLLNFFEVLKTIKSTGFVDKLNVYQRVVENLSVPDILDYFIYKICADFNVFIILLK